MSRSRTEARSKAKTSKKRRLDLTSEEIAVVLAACTRYRQTIPSYLAASREELLRIDAVLRKLS